MIFKPLEIRFRLSSPVVGTDPIHLDALVASVMIHTCGMKARDNHGVGWEPRDNLPLPLARYHWGEFWWYRASAVWPNGEGSRVSWVKRWEREYEDLLDLGKATQVVTSLGRYKEAHVPMELVYVPELVFFAVGDLGDMKHFCKKVKFVGKKSNQGYGFVEEVTIRALDIDMDGYTMDWCTEAGRPARNMPVGFCEETGLNLIGKRLAPYRPPYWRVGFKNVVNVGV